MSQVPLEPSKWQEQFVERLLACPSLQTATERQNVISQLPHDLQHSISYQNAANKVAVSTLARACLHYVGGVSFLLEQLRYFDKGKTGLQALETFLAAQPIPPTPVSPSPVPSSKVEPKPKKKRETIYLIIAGLVAGLVVVGLVGLVVYLIVISPGGKSVTPTATVATTFTASSSPIFTLPSTQVNPALSPSTSMPVLSPSNTFVPLITNIPIPPPANTPASIPLPINTPKPTNTLPVVTRAVSTQIVFDSIIPLDQSNLPAPGKKSAPYSIAIDDAKNLYVTDDTNKRTIKFSNDPSPSPLLTIGGKEGSNDDEFNSSFGVVVDKQGYIYISDTYNDRIQKYDKNGKFVKKIDAINGKCSGKFNKPRAMTMDKQGNFYVVDSLNYRILKFNDQWQCQLSWGRLGTGDGEFRYPNPKNDIPVGPSGITVNSQGYVYVVDKANNRVQKFDANGTFISTWDNQNNGGGNFDVSYRYSCRYPR